MGIEQKHSTARDETNDQFAHDTFSLKTKTKLRSVGVNTFLQRKLIPMQPTKTFLFPGASRY